MSVNIYDDVLVQKLKYWTEKADVDVYTTDEARRLIEVIADKTNDKSIKLPMIVVRRSNGFTIRNSNKQPLTYNGLHLRDQYINEYNSYTTKYRTGEITREEYLQKCKELQEYSDKISSVSLNVIPIEINYNIDVYTRYQKENDLYIRNLIFNIINYPTFQIIVKYNGINVEHVGNIRISDNNIRADQRFSLKLFSDQICRQTISINIDDAYLWDTRLRQNVSIASSGEVVLEIKDKYNNDFIIEQLN